MSITFIRHSESFHNWMNRLQGNCQTETFRDCGITQRGKRQAYHLEHEFDLLLVSPLRRCQETFDYSNIVANEVRTCALVREKKEDMCDFLENEELVYDTDESFKQQVSKALQYIKTLPYKNIGVITHSEFVWEAFEVDLVNTGDWNVSMI